MLTHDFFFGVNVISSDVVFSVKMKSYWFFFILNHVISQVTATVKQFSLTKHGGLFFSIIKHKLTGAHFVFIIAW